MQGCKNHGCGRFKEATDTFITPMAKLATIALASLSFLQPLLAQNSPFGDGGRMTNGARSSDSGPFTSNPFGTSERSKNTQVKEVDFDIAKVNQPGRAETRDKFQKVWTQFLSEYSLDEDGNFTTGPGTRPLASDAYAQNAFIHFVAAERPTVILQSDQVCSSCTRGKKPGYVNGLVKEVICDKCRGNWEIKLVEKIRLLYSAQLPPKTVWPAAKAKPSKEPTAAKAKPPQAADIATEAKLPSFTVGPSPEEVKAFNQLKLAADAGDPIAQFKVGLAYFKGSGVEADVFEGAKWYRKSAEQGNVDAQWHLANAYDYFQDKRLGDRLKIGIYECARQSLKWWLMAAEQGHAPSQFKYAQTYYRELKGTSLKGTTSPLFSEEERPKYMGLALKWSRKAAEQGNVDAQYLLGMIYDDGDALGQRQIEDAFVWWSLSAAGGNAWAKEKVEPLELQLDSSVMSRARARITSLKAEIEVKKAGK